MTKSWLGPKKSPSQIKKGTKKMKSLKKRRPPQKNIRWHQSRIDLSRKDLD